MPHGAYTAGERVLGPRAVSTAPVPTALSIWVAGPDRRREVSLSLVEEQHAPHRDLSRSVAELTVPRPLVERAARRMVTLMHHLHLALESGASVRLRKAGTFRSSWHVDLLARAAVLCSWPVAAANFERLDELDRVLRGCAAATATPAALEALAEHVRDFDAEVRREHEVNVVIRQHVEMPTSELLGLLERRGLLEAV